MLATGGEQGEGPAVLAVLVGEAEARSAVSGGEMNVTNGTDDKPLPVAEAKSRGGARAGAGRPASSGPLRIPQTHTKYVVTKETFAGKKGSERESVRWVLDNFLVADVTPADAPSAFAWTYLCVSRDEAGVKTRDNLFSDTIERLLPTKTQLETSEKFEDDGRSLLATLDRLAAQAKEAGNG